MRISRWTALSITVALLLVASTGCVVPPAHPGVVEPGAAIRATLDPTVEVTVVADGRRVGVSSLIGRVEAVDSVAYTIRVASGELANGRRARELEGAIVRLPRSADPKVRILTADASVAEARTFAVIGAATAAFFTMVCLALCGGST